jgi:hypothetical protein
MMTIKAISHYRQQKKYALSSSTVSQSLYPPTQDPFSIEIDQPSTSLTGYQKSISKKTTLRAMLELLSLWEQEQWNSLYAHEHSAG